MTRKNISIAILANHYEVALFDGGEIVGDIEWVFTPDQVAAAVKKLLSEPAPMFETATDGTDKTEEIAPFSELICDQPSFPHDSTDPDFEMVRDNYRANPYTGFIERYGTAYSHDYNVSQELGEAAIRYILFEEAQS